MNKVYKVLRIIFLTLAILSMLFAFASKVVFAASSGGSSTYYGFWSDQPYYVGPPLGVKSDGYVTSNIINALVNRIQSGPYPTGYPYQDHGFDNVNLILFREYNSSNHQIQCSVFYDAYISSFDYPSDLTQNSNFVTFRSLNNYGIRITYDIDNDSIIYVNSINGNHIIPFYGLGSNSCWISSVFTDPNPVFQIYQINQNQDIFNYPLYIRDGEMSFSSQVVFSTNIRPSGGDEDSTIDDIEDNIDEADDSNLPGVDDSDPSDPTSTPAWLKKILTGLKNINKNIQGIGITINKTLNNIKNKITELAETVAEWCVNFWDNVRDFFSGLISDVARIKDTIVEWGTLPSEEDMADEWDDGIEMSGLSDIFSFWHDCKQLLGYVFDDPYDSYTPQTLNANIPASPVNIDRENWSLTRGSSSNSSLVFTVKVKGGTILNPNDPTTPGVTAPTKTFSANFDWYKQIKDDYLWFIVPWFYVTALYVFVKSFPGVLNGTSPVLHFARHPEG